MKHEVICTSSCFFFPQSMEELVSKSVPENIRLNRELKLDEPLCECVGVVCVCGGKCVYVCV